MHLPTYRAPSSEQKGGRGATDRGDWNVFYLELHNMDLKVIGSGPVTWERAGAASPRLMGMRFLAARPAATYNRTQRADGEEIAVPSPFIVSGRGLSHTGGRRRRAHGAGPGHHFRRQLQSRGLERPRSEARIALIFGVAPGFIAARGQVPQFLADGGDEAREEGLRGGGRGRRHVLPRHRPGAAHKARGRASGARRRRRRRAT